MTEYVARVRAPSNIALIKYMGKSDASRNLASNPSLSLTLRNLATWVRLEARASAAPSLALRELRAGEIPGIEFFEGGLSEAAAARVRACFDRVVPLIRQTLEESPCGFRASAVSCATANTFPSGAGVASSASSFAALTTAWALGLSADRAEFRREFESGGALRHRLSQISRQCSGSSCRSFLGPWVEWSGDRIDALASRLPAFSDLVILIDTSAKAVSSSEAHRRVETSDLYAQRAERTGRRLERLRRALSENDLPAVRETAWAESMEMHALFHTAQPPFSYWKPGTVEVLSRLMEGGGGAFAGLEAPVVTMDAGANIHLLIPSSAVSEWKKALSVELPAFRVLEDSQGTGPEIREDGE